MRRATSDGGTSVPRNSATNFAPAALARMAGALSTPFHQRSGGSGMSYTLRYIVR
ncbi:MAG: hypothetical protein Q8S73_24785 [Deltaproteobacteria bacterium]|nr:hypothetical protein [Deltaproteobacteria bacterium]